ncbi:hypothetical protein K7711_23350 [Nocardia sp. CA2R105]|uniref:hypothetical protein n=1 Tax=Nocardia coffeae TaxID=2873381 RepID=UPI001CA7A12B|nr:hypothetical protein [Nocardia coffeae]MBY8859423.1 hypothetical protein [Nocardia coffeae]
MASTRLAINASAKSATEPLRCSRSIGSPRRRRWSAWEIAESVAFLAGPGRWGNGQVVFTNGGIG